MEEAIHSFIAYNDEEFINKLAYDIVYNEREYTFDQALMSGKTIMGTMFLIKLSAKIAELQGDNELAKQLYIMLEEKFD